MTQELFYQTLKNSFFDVVREAGLSDEELCVSTKALTAKEAIGETKRKDFPILTGKDVMVQAACRGSLGQAFTDAPAVWSGTFRELETLDLLGDPHARGIFIAAINAVMAHLGRADGTVHCKNEGPERCAAMVEEYIRTTYGSPRIALVGYQPAMLERLSAAFKVRVLDLNPDNVGQVKSGVTVEHGERDFESAVLEWADLVLVTGSTVCNGTIVNFLDIKKEVLFYGTSLAGAAPLMGLKRLCFADCV